MKSFIRLEVTQDQQSEIEEYCVNAGIKISDYLMKLHAEFQSSLAGIQIKGGKPIHWISSDEAQKMFPKDVQDKGTIDETFIPDCSIPLKRKKSSK